MKDSFASVLTTKRGKPFNTNSFNALLKNRKYIGEYSYQDVVIPGGVPAIVPEDLFYRVQQRMEKNKRAPAMAKAHENFLLTTKLLCDGKTAVLTGRQRFINDLVEVAPFRIFQHGQELTGIPKLHTPPSVVC